MSGIPTPRLPQSQQWSMDTARGRIRPGGLRGDKEGLEELGKIMSNLLILQEGETTQPRPHNKTVLDQGLELKFGDSFHKKWFLMVHESAGE